MDSGGCLRMHGLLSRESLLLLDGGKGPGGDRDLHSLMLRSLHFMTRISCAQLPQAVVELSMLVKTLDGAPLQARHGYRVKVSAVNA